MGSGIGVSTIVVGGLGLSSSSFLLGTLRDLVSVVTVACRISMRRCSALVLLSLSGTNGEFAVGVCKAVTILAMPAKM